jgi:hypothetical protein
MTGRYGQNPQKPTYDRNLALAGFSFENISSVEFNGPNVRMVFSGGKRVAIRRPTKLNGSEQYSWNVIPTGILRAGEDATRHFNSLLTSYQRRN